MYKTYEDATTFQTQLTYNDTSEYHRAIRASLMQLICYYKKADNIYTDSFHVILNKGYEFQNGYMYCFVIRYSVRKYAFIYTRDGGKTFKLMYPLSDESKTIEETEKNFKEYDIMTENQKFEVYKNLPVTTDEDKSLTFCLLYLTAVISFSDEQIQDSIDILSEESRLVLIEKLKLFYRLRYSLDEDLKKIAEKITSDGKPLAFSSHIQSTFYDIV